MRSLIGGTPICRTDFSPIGRRIMDPKSISRHTFGLNMRLIIGTIALLGTIVALLLGSALKAQPQVGKPFIGCRAIDGDTLRCGRERIRLLGIDAPEMPGHCRRGRRCAVGNPYASKSSLVAAASGRLIIFRVGRDRYGRTLATVTGHVGDLSCWQIEPRNAMYRADWDHDGRFFNQCPKSARKRAK